VGAPVPAEYTLSLHADLPICGWTRRSAGTLSSVATAKSGATGSPTTRSPSMPVTTARRAAVLRAHDAASSAKPSAPSHWLIAHISEEHTSELQSRENLVCRLL